LLTRVRCTGGTPPPGMCVWRGWLLVRPAARHCRLCLGEGWRNWLTRAQAEEQ
jgi:hypothetical protein